MMDFEEFLKQKGENINTMNLRNFKVMCVTEKKDKINHNKIGFTAGVVYSVVDGKLIDDDGIGWPIFSDNKFTCLADIRDYRDGNWEYIGEFKEV